MMTISERQDVAIKDIKCELEGRPPDKALIEHIKNTDYSARLLLEPIGR